MPIIRYFYYHIISDPKKPRICYLRKHLNEILLNSSPFYPKTFLLPENYLKLSSKYLFLKTSFSPASLCIFSKLLCIFSTISFYPYVIIIIMTLQIWNIIIVFIFSYIRERILNFSSIFFSFPFLWANKDLNISMLKLV